MDNITNKLAQSIRQKALTLGKMNQAIKAALPTDCHSHVEVAGISENQLIILTDSPVWQTRLRMLSQIMLETLYQQTGIKLSRVKLKLAPAKRSIIVEPPAPRSLSQHSGKLISQTADSISDDNLRMAMQRLSKKAK